MRQFFSAHRLFFIAVCLVLLRFALWDAQLLSQQLLPRHDGTHGFAAFATSMHALRTEGDIAWWSPVHLEGYAQYFIGFLSPLAPTFGSIVFVLCGWAVRLLGLLGIALPEYALYVLLNSLVYPFLATFFLLKLSSLFFRHTAVFWLVGFGYIFTGMGLWNDAWFYWQAPFFLFLLLYVVVAFCQQATARRYAGLWAGVLLFAAGADFWAVHNLLFIAVFLVVFAIFQPRGWLRTFAKEAFACVRRHWVLSLVGAVCLLVVAVQVGAVFLEQGGRYFRFESAEGFSVWEAFSSGTRYDQYLRFLTVELFRPSVDTAFVNEQLYTIFIHAARYIGAGLLPLLGVALLQKRWACRQFLCLSVCLLVVCLIPGFLLPMWQAFFASDRAFFFFYVHFFQLALLFTAAAGLDAVADDASLDNQQAVLWLLRGAMALCVVAFAAMAAVGWLSKSVLLLVLLVFAFSGLVLLVRGDGRQRTVWLALLLLLYGGDVSRYYYECAYQDHAFSVQWFDTGTQQGSPLLRGRMQAMEDGSFGRQIAQLSPPVNSVLWPNNQYLLTRYYSELVALQAQQPAWYAALFPEEDGALPPLGFYHPSPAYGTEMALPYGEDGILLLPDAAASADFAMTAGGYNRFAFRYTAPAAGSIDSALWLVARQLYDPAWRFVLDAGTPDEQVLAPRRANVMHMAVAVPPGTHTLSMEYRPFARAWYPVFSLALLAGSALFTWHALPHPFWRGRRKTPK